LWTISSESYFLNDLNLFFLSKKSKPMAGYSSFSIKSVKTKFGLKIKKQILFQNHINLPPTDWCFSSNYR
jgi:hypothetical protein